MLFKRDVSRLLPSPSRMPMFGDILCLSLSADKSSPEVRYKKLRLDASSGGVTRHAEPTSENTKFLCSFFPLGLALLALPGWSPPYPEQVVLLTSMTDETPARKKDVRLITGSTIPASLTQIHLQRGVLPSSGIQQWVSSGFWNSPLQVAPKVWRNSVVSQAALCSFCEPCLSVLKRKVHVKMCKARVMFAPWVFCVGSKGNTERQQKCGNCNLGTPLGHINPSLSTSWKAVKSQSHQ